MAGWRERPGLGVAPGLPVAAAAPGGRNRSAWTSTPSAALKTTGVGITSLFCGKSAGILSVHKTRIVVSVVFITAGSGGLCVVALINAKALPSPVIVGVHSRPAPGVIICMSGLSTLTMTACLLSMS